MRPATQPLPMLPGPWQPLTTDESAEFLARLDLHVSAAGIDPPFCRIGRVRDLRALPLSFYPGWLLVEGEAELDKGMVGTFDVLMGPGFLACLCGDTNLLHALNTGNLWRQLTPVSNKPDPGEGGQQTVQTQADYFPSPLAELEPLHTGPDYFRFYANNFRGSEGVVRLIETVDDLRACGATEPCERWQDQIQPLRMAFAQADEAGNAPAPLTLHAASTMLYDGELSTVQFEVSPNGTVRLLGEQLIAQQVAPPEQVQGPLRQVRPARPSPRS